MAGTSWKPHVFHELIKFRSLKRSNGSPLLPSWLQGFNENQNRNPANILGLAGGVGSLRWSRSSDFCLRPAHRATALLLATTTKCSMDGEPTDHEPATLSTCHPSYCRASSPIPSSAAHHPHKLVEQGFLAAILHTNKQSLRLRMPIGSCRQVILVRPR